MRIRLSRLIFTSLTTLGLATFVPEIASANEPSGVEILARGPVHEAFAATLEVHKDGSVVVRKAPPEAIEELPPDQKPSGDNVQWVPGYWHFEEEREDYIWISGFWRVPPPGRVWVAGSWREVRGGHQWVHGFWQESRPAVQQQEVEYLTAPPAPIEFAPSIPAPSDTHLYVPGSWVWRSHRYVWRPGFWVDHRPGWCWVPAHYRWTPAGYIFIDGYWDMPLAERGVLFAPVYFSQAVYSRPAFVYSPTIVVSEPALHTSLFVRRGWGCYYFGDYFENRYTTVGYSSWCSNVRGSGFGVSISVGRSVHYDPLWDYYRVANRHDRVWASNVTEVYVGRFNGTVARPPRTLVQQNVIVNNVTNVTNVTNNNTTVVNNVNSNNTTVNNNQMMLTSLTNVSQTNKSIALKPIAAAERAQEQQYAKEIRQVSAQRKQLETSIVDRGQAPVKGADAPKSVKLDMSKTSVVRAQVSTEKVKDVPPPAATLVGKPNPVNAANNAAALKPAPLTPTAPNAALKPEMKPTLPAATAQPSIKIEPKPMNPQPVRVDPKPTTQPSNKVEPLPTRVDPKPMNPQPTRVDTKPMPAPAPSNLPPAPATKNLPPAPAPAAKPVPAPAPTPTPAPIKIESRPTTPAPIKIESRPTTPAPIKIESRPTTPAPAPAPVSKPNPTPAPAPVFKPTPAPAPAPVFKPAPTPAPAAVAPVAIAKPAPVASPAPSLKPSSPPPSSKDSKPSDPKEKKG